LVDLLVRESALALAHQKLEEAKNEVLAEKARLEALKPGLMKKTTSEREQGIKSAMDDLSHYDSQLRKAESLTTLIHKDTRRWLECCLKTGSQDYAAALAAQDFPVDWSRFSYSFEMLLKSFQMGLQDLMVVFKRENPAGTRTQLLLDSIRKLLPIARQVEIDVEFFNRILTHQAKQRRSAGKVSLHPEYSWCETVDQLGVLTMAEALETLRELLSASTGFLANLSQVIKREQFLVETRAAQAGRSKTEAQASFLQNWWDGIKPAAAQRVVDEKLEEIICETEALLMDGEFTARFNRSMAQSVARTPSVAPEKPATASPFPQSDAELRTLKTKLQAELEEVAKLKAGLGARERTLRENEQQLRENEQLFADKCKRELAVLEEGKVKLVALEDEIVLKARQAQEKRAEDLVLIEETKAELAARSLFMDESEQRLLTKGQEQLESLAELEQKEEELLGTKRDLNAMRKEMGLPMIPLRAKPVDEFEE